MGGRERKGGWELEQERKSGKKRKIWKVGVDKDWEGVEKKGKVGGRKQKGGWEDKKRER